MKKILVLILLFLTFLISIQAQSEYDVKCAELINNSKWFELNDYYVQNKDHLGDFMKLCAGSLIGYYFNEPDEAIRNLEILTDKYAEELAGENINFAILLAENYALNKEFNKAVGIYSSLVSQLKSIVPDELINKFRGNQIKYQLYASHHAMEMNKLDQKNDCIVPIRLIGGGIFLDINHNGLVYNSIFDTGASMCLATLESAKKMGLNYLADSIFLNNSLPAKIAIADSIYIGSLLLTNVPFAILPNNDDFNSLLNLPDNSESLFDLVIGNDIMRLLEEIRIDVRNKKMTIPISPSSVEFKKNMIYVGNHTYINLNVNGNDILVFYDSGYNGDFVIKPGVLDSPPIHNNIPVKQKSLTAEGIKEIELMELDEIVIKINDRKMIVPTSYIGEIEEKEAQGYIGKTLLDVSDYITISFKDMWIKCE